MSDGGSEINCGGFDGGAIYLRAFNGGLIFP